MYENGMAKGLHNKKPDERSPVFHRAFCLLHAERLVSAARELEDP